MPPRQIDRVDAGRRRRRARHAGSRRACYRGRLTHSLEETMADTSPGFAFDLSYPTTAAAGPIDGRLLLIIAPDGEKEPRFQVRSGIKAAQIFGVDVNGLEAGEAAVIDHTVFGYPLASLADLPAGDFCVQAVLHRYETFQLATGHTVKLPMDRGEGQQWNKAPGNLYSEPQTLRLDPASASRIRLSLDQVIPPIEPPVDTKYVRHVRIKSQRLTEFWGRPMYLGAHVLVPEGFDEHPEARYPLVVFHGHFPSDFQNIRETPPDPELEPEFSERFGVEGYNRIEQEEAWAFFQAWRGEDLPRMLIVEIQHPTPYYDDSYAVNSASMGPWGDAIQYELIPHIEEQFRGIGEGWARFLYGGSTGGWESLAVQVFYPDEYNGCFAACPDPVDFRQYLTVDIYEDDNAYYREGTFRRLERPSFRNYLGHISATMADDNHMELVLGTHGRSGGQFDIWEAVYSPQGEDGYPRRLWDKRTGAIDHSVAAYWREHYDLAHIIHRDWATLGPKLAGKIHVYCGTMDNFYLNNAVYLLQAVLEGTTDPYYAGEVDYGDRAEHCWNGDHDHPIHISRLRYNLFYVDRILARIEATAPADADLTSWRY
jgi:hypothetical protein